MGCQYYAPASDCEAGCANTFTVAIPKITFGRGTLTECGARAQRLGLKQVAIFTDSFLATHHIIDTVCQSLAKVGISYSLFSDIRIEPSDVTVADGAKFLNSGNFDGVISVGGGSVIDTAKAAMVVSRYQDPVGAYFAPPIGGGKAVPGPVLPHIACPTTSGTGSESTSISVIRVMEYDTKYVFASPWILPDEAIVDPACCDSLPSNVVASTGFDLLCHALECYTARAYTKHAGVTNINQRQLIQGANPWSDMSAREALRLASDYLVRGVRDATDHEARDQLSWAATLAGCAFGNSGTHLPHAMSYGVTHLMSDITTEGYDTPSPFVPHGISVAVSAPAIFEYTAEATPERHLEAAGFLNADQQGATLDDAGEVLATRIVQLMKDCNLPNGLSGVGFTQNDIKPLAASSIQQKRAILNAPRESNIDDLESMYSNALQYWT